MCQYCLLDDYEAPTMTDEIAEFRERRNAALRTLDMSFARKMLPAASDEVRLIAMHKGRYECVDIDASLRKESEQWLRERNYQRMYGCGDWPTDGTLPE